MFGISLMEALWSLEEVFGGLDREIYLSSQAKKKQQKEKNKKEKREE